jgi:hypothetical protein
MSQEASSIGFNLCENRYKFSISIISVIASGTQGGV